ncbi:MAG: class I SAM-dependent methyltransferase [Candidatus Competibacteraceae bacterium]|nr:class I SAM-dependent methyltransferase [Candidatus Competibacteraceae bacterium]
MNKKSVVGCESDLPIGAKFHEGIAAGWSKGYSGGSFGRRLSFFLPILDRNINPSQNWLDLGCGSGVLTKELLDRGALVSAVDGSPSMLREAQKHINDKEHGVVVWLQSDVQSVAQFSDASFDGILCSSVVEYVKCPYTVLSEAARLLRSDGKLIISLPPKLSAVRTAQKIIRKIGLLFGRDVFSYLAVSRFEIDPNHLQEWLSKAGFALDHITYFDPILPKVFLAIFRPALMILEARKK